MENLHLALIQDYRGLLALKCYDVHITHNYIIYICCTTDGEKPGISDIAQQPRAVGEEGDDDLDMDDTNILAVTKRSVHKLL